MNKIDQLRYLVSNYNIEGYLIPKNDNYFNEFVNENNDRLKYISGFSGSFGYALILKNKNYLFVDGRYTLQAKIESSKNFTILEISKQSIHEFIKKLNIKIGFDPSLFKYSWINKNKNLVPIQENLIDKIWKRNQNENNKAFILTENFHGEDHKIKISKVKQILKISSKKAYLIQSSENICWLLNIRGHDTKFSPILNSSALITKNNIFIFCKLKKITSSIKQFYGKKIIFINENQIFKKLLEYKNIIIGTDQNTSFSIIDFIKKNNFKFKFQNDPIFNLKSKKNVTEILNTKLCHIYDGVAVTKFIFWLKNHKNLNKINEIKAEHKLEQFRKKNFSYLFSSFQTISAFGKNGAIIHYRATKKTNLKFNDNNLYLIDSGGQYKLGTTDITRTVLFGNPSKFQKKIYTLVLQGHIAVHEYKINKNTYGRDLDREARKFLNQENLDFNHSTGHGVGQFLNVHENPPSISKLSNQKFYGGEIVSNEPGFYKTNKFGIRIENLIFVEKINTKFRFCNLTLVPYEKELIIKSMLSKKQIYYINNYHQHVFDSLKAFMNKRELEFLKIQCSPI